MAIGVRESCDHVDRDMGPGPFRYCIWVERRGFGLGIALCSLTGFTALDIGFNILLHLGPPVLSEH